MTVDGNVLKLSLAAFLAALMTYMGQIIVPVLILVGVMLLDYLTGVHAAFVRHELSSRAGLIGILKKLSYLAMVAVACVIDYLIATVGAQLGTVIAVQFVGQLVVFWLILNELISILENVQKIGGPVPPFVAKLLQHLRGKVEESLPELPDEPQEPEGKHFKK
ncbi:MAG: phage holin family protein [Firmicutes bacterium]|nr:phage holin family protein [Bacillota bacterium]